MKNRWDIKKQIDPGQFPDKVISPVDGAEMVLIPEGDFIMGISEEQLVQMFLLDQKWNPVFSTETTKLVMASLGKFIWGGRTPSRMALRIRSG